MWMILKKELHEKKKEKDEDKNYRNHITMINCTNENEIKGIVQCVDKLKNQIDENEKEKRKLQNNQNCIMMMNHVNANEIKFQRKLRHKGVNELLTKHYEMVKKNTMRKKCNFINFERCVTK